MVVKVTSCRPALLLVIKAEVRRDDVTGGIIVIGGGRPDHADTTVIIGEDVVKRSNKQLMVMDLLSLLILVIFFDVCLFCVGTIAFIVFLLQLHFEYRSTKDGLFEADVLLPNSKIFKWRVMSTGWVWLIPINADNYFLVCIYLKL